ncbi:MAG: hypothetical protein K1W20_04875 [Lachnospiraceae bacterium]
MTVRNNSLKIIGVGETSILPGETAELPAGYDKNPVVLRYVARGVFSTVEPEKKKKGAQKAGEPAKVDGSAKTAGAGSTGSQTGEPGSADDSDAKK